MINNLLYIYFGKLSGYKSARTDQIQMNMYG
jgi:hypothetical protein